VGSCIIDNSFGTVLDQEFQQLERLYIAKEGTISPETFFHNEPVLPYLVNLSPFLRGLVGEPFVDQGHDLIEQLAVITIFSTRALAQTRSDRN
jgi:hypothetical protein